MPEIKKYEVIIPSNHVELKSFLATQVEMCDFIGGETEHKYAISHADAADYKLIAQSFDSPIQLIFDRENLLDESRTALVEFKGVNIPIINKYLKKIKSSENCTDAFKQRYKIKSNAISVNTDDLEANFKIKNVGQIHEFHFTKHKLDRLNMNFYIKKEGETSYHLLFSASNSPYEYTGTLSQGDQIFSVYTYKNKEVGIPSRILLVNL